MREYPDRPIVGVGGIVVDGDLVLLVRRANEPLKGEWSIPGGAVEAGETLTEAVMRELREESVIHLRPIRQSPIIATGTTRGVMANLLAKTREISHGRVVLSLKNYRGGGAVTKSLICSVEGTVTLRSFSTYAG